MKKLLLFIMSGLLLVGCANTANDNPFFKPYTNKYGAPPFDKIKPGDYMPAFLEGIKEHQAEIDSIANNPAAPTFDNTVAAFDYSGQLLERVSSVFFNLYAADTNKQLDSIAQEITPKLSEHNDNIYQNEKLFQRIKTLYDHKDSLGLDEEQMRLLDKDYQKFIRNGAALNPEQKERLRKINTELGMASLKYGQNVLAETNLYKKVISNKADLVGLPQGVIDAAAETAKADSLDGKWVFTTQKSSFIPVLQYSPNRELRKELLMAYTTRANHNDKYDNKKLIVKMIKLKVEKAHLLGYKTPAAFILADQMAKTPQAVDKFLESVWKPSVAKAKQEAAELQKLMDKDHKGQKLQPWDWWYYAEKLKEQKYKLDEEQLRPYFKLENVRKGMFELATKLYGIHFTKLNDMPVYNPDVDVFKVTDADSSLIGILYTDYFPRPGKHQGAWMENITQQYVKDGVDHRPIVINVANFTKPTKDQPSLLNMDEVETMFHEFGHALHGLFSKCTYPSLSGTNVPRDFVEMPSQIMENWAFQPQVMKLYAFNYKTGKLMPKALMDKIQESSKFNQGFNMTELLSAAILDMDYHNISDTANFDVEAFEKAAMKKMGMIPQIIVRYRSTYFLHIFTEGYDAGYYSYTWSEELDDDAFQSFVKTGDVFNRKRAEAFRKDILQNGDTQDPMEMYIKFLGRKPSPEALLEKRGLK